MNYLLMPLDQQFDGGFGVIGNSFRAAAEQLEQRPEGSVGFHQHLPISYLYRHACELFIKSAIITIHRAGSLPWRDGGTDADPKILVNGKPRRLYDTHSIVGLHSYAELLLKENAAFIKQHCRTDWTTPERLTLSLGVIEKYDQGGTYFRYPSRDDSQNEQKSAFKQVTPESLFAQMNSEGPKVLALAYKDEEGNITSAYCKQDLPDKPLQSTREACADLEGFSVGLRMELAQGR